MKRHVRPALVAILALCAGVLAFGAATAQQQPADPPKPSFAGKVVSVADGDTITVLVGKEQHRIRLEGIDCPESRQDFGTKAKEAIAGKVFGKEVTIKWKARDKYKRILGDVYLGDRHINLEMVQEGWAWHYTQYSKDAQLAKAEKEAKEARKGLWAAPNPIPPWEFRNGKKGEKQAEDKGPADGKETELAKLTVYVTKTGEKYHREGCRSLAKSSIPTTLGEAAGKYAPCSICNPPILRPPQAKKDGAETKE
jgi:endonuclease YncB( thermonuclease family)